MLSFVKGNPIKEESSSTKSTGSSSWTPNPPSGTSPSHGGGGGGGGSTVSRPQPGHPPSLPGPYSSVLSPTPNDYGAPHMDNKAGLAAAAAMFWGWMSRLRGVDLETQIGVYS